jgi:hypothetical protein
MKPASYRFNVAAVPKVATIATVHCPKKTLAIFEFTVANRSAEAKGHRAQPRRWEGATPNSAAARLMCLDRNNQGIPKPQ